MCTTQQAFPAKARTGVFLFRYGYTDLETSTEKLKRYAVRTGVRELGEDAVKQILSSALDDIPLEQQL